jgi:hypothetical protein
MTDTTMVEARHEFERRAQARLDEARAAVEAAAAAERAAFDEVDRLRGEVGLGRATKGELHSAKTRLAKCQEVTATAEATVRAIEREVERERDERDRVARLAARERDAEAAARDRVHVAAFNEATAVYAAALESFVAAVPSIASKHKAPIWDLRQALSRLRRYPPG